MSDKTEWTPRDSNLHLSVSVRSFRSENASAFVESVLSIDDAGAKSLYGILARRQLPSGNNQKFRQSKTMASSEGVWFRTHRGCCLVRCLPPSATWTIGKTQHRRSNRFLNDKDDVRSSYFLEEVATEFDIQGLELDWTCVCWDGDLFFQNGQWKRRKFKGTKWQNINDIFARRYLMNAYRVLLTRARQGMVIFVPEGDLTDRTRLPEFYDGTYKYLCGLGIKEI